MTPEQRAEVLDLIRLAINDPGAILRRERDADGYAESVGNWGARAVMATLDQHPILAIRSDQPTQWAYDQACKALENHRQRADQAERERDELKAAHKRALDVAAEHHDPTGSESDECLAGCPGCHMEQALEGEARSELAEARAALDRVRSLHRGFRIYDECGHKHEAPDTVLGVQLISDVGLVCADGYLYTICAGCCTDGEYQTEHCATDHPKGLCSPCSTLAALDGSPS